MKQQKHFNTAEELMEHLKKQIVQYSEDEDSFDITTVENTFNKRDDSEFSRLFAERDSNNLLWNINTERPITSHRRFIGKFLVISKKMIRKILRWYVSKSFESQSAFNGSVTRSINELSNIVIQQKAKLEENEGTLNSLRDYIQNLEKNAIEEKNVAFNDLNSQIQNLNNQAQNSENKIQNSNKRIEIIGEQYKSEINFMQYRLRQLKKNSSNEIEQVSSKLFVKDNKETSASDADSNSFDYLHFENKFRGSIEEIKDRQRVYLPYFTNKQNILDIGCGRGEFIELLMENNISVNGVDLNREMVEYCQDRGLPVEYGDAINYLKTVGDNELGGMFLGQVIEHMPFEQILLLVDLAFKKLKTGSYLIMETPNPLSLAIFYRTFYVDPTHVKPVHPLTIQYVVESVGFTKTELSYSSRVESNWFVPHIESVDNSIKNINEFNEGINRVNDLLFGNLDYAIIAKK